MPRNIMIVICVCVSVSLFFNVEPVCSQPWSDFAIRSLPDTCFALVEIDKNGRKVRHFPYRDMNGFIDINQLIYGLGTFGDETWVESKNKEIARKDLEEHYHRLKLKQLKEEMTEPININKADLEVLVRLPNIGPVSAVRIYRFRQTNGSFQRIEDVKKVEGIGSSTFAGIRHYVAVED